MKISGQKETYDVYFYTNNKSETVMRVDAWGRDKIMGGPITIWESYPINAQSFELSTEKQKKELFQRLVDKCESRGYPEIKPRITIEVIAIFIPVIFLLILLSLISLGMLLY